MVRVYVLYYKIINQELTFSHYKFFGTRNDLNKFLANQDVTFCPIAIQKINVSKADYVEQVLANLDKLGVKR